MLLQIVNTPRSVGLVSLLIIVQLCNHVHSAPPSRITTISPWMSGIPWATGAYETPRSYDSDYVSWAVWSDGTGRDKTRITVTLYDTSRVNPFYGLPGVQIGEYNLITSNEAFEFQLKNIQNDRMVRSVPNFEVVRKSGNVDRYQYNCFEVPIRSFSTSFRLHSNS